MVGTCTVSVNAFIILLLVFCYYRTAATQRSVQGLMICTLRKSIDDLKPRLMTQRAIITYPNETTGAAYKWWCDFIAEEEARQERMCASCKSIREELTTFVVHQAKIKVNETRVLNKQKLSRREELLEKPYFA